MGTPLRVKDDTAAPAYVNQGFGYDDGALAVDSVSAIDRYLAGLPFTANGRLCVEEGATVRVNEGWPFTSSERIAIGNSNDTITVYPFTDDLNSLSGNETATFTRSTSKFYQDSDGNWTKAAVNEAAFTGSSVLLQGSIQNKNTNYNLSPDAGLTDILFSAPITVTRQLSDSILRSNGWGNAIDNADINGYMFEVFNGNAGRGGVAIDGRVGNLNDHWAYVQIYAVTSGLIELKIGAATVDSVNAVAGEYYILKGSATPTGVANPLQIFVDAGQTFRFIANQLAEITFDIESIVEAAGASATQAADDLSVSTSGYAVNNVAYLLYYPQGIKDIGIQWLLDSRVDANNRFDVIALASGDVRYRKEVGGSVTQATAAFSYDSPLYALIKQTDTSGQDVLLSNGNTGNNPDTSAIVYDSTMQIGAQDDSFGASSLFAPFAQFKRFEGTAAEIDALTLDEAIAKTSNVDYVQNGLPFTQDSQLAVNLVT